MNLGDKIKKRRLELDLTLEEVGTIVGVSKSTVMKWETGYIENMKRDKIALLAKALRVSPLWVMGMDEVDYEKLPSNVYPIHRRKLIPLLGTIAAGQPIIAEEQVEYLVANESDIEAHFALKIKGDSMIGARIHDGDIVFIRQQPDVEDGEIAAVLIDGEATLKRVYKMPGRVQLRAENPKYEPRDFTDKNCNDFKILGKAVGFQSRL